MKPVARYRGGFRWEGIAARAYAAEGADFRDVTRQALFDAKTGLASELRYFEVAAGGHTRLERHAHAHGVMILRGKGRVLVGTEVQAVAPYDLVRVPPRTWHQFRAAETAPLGFLCLVAAERDRPQRPTPAELDALRRHPEVAAFIRS